MKKSYIIIIVAFIIVGIIVGYYFINLDNEPIVNNPNNYNNKIISWENSDRLDTTNQIEYLESCRENMNLDLEESETLSEDIRYCVRDAKESIPTKEDIDKFKLLNNLRTIEECEYGSFSCDLTKDIQEPCNKIWEISYRSLGVRPHKLLYSINKCGDNYYLYYEMSENGPTMNRIDIIELSDEIVNKL